MINLTAAAIVLLASTIALPGAAEPGASPGPTGPTSPVGAEVAKREAPPAKGDVLPDFKLKNAEGQWVLLSEQLASGPVVITFYRGSWCPYCVKQLDSIEESVAAINELGATVLAISPETPDHAVDLRERLGLSYQLLVDKDNQLADALALMFTLDEATVERYEKYGLDIGVSNGTDTWQLPIPATFVVDKDRVVRYAWTDEDYTKRAKSAVVLKTLRELDR